MNSSSKIRSNECTLVYTLSLAFVILSKSLNWSFQKINLEMIQFAVYILIVKWQGKQHNFAKHLVRICGHEYLTIIIPQVCVGYMRWWIANEVHSAELAIIMSYPATSTSGILLFFLNAYKISRILLDLYWFVSTMTRTVTIFGEHGIIYTYCQILRETVSFVFPKVLMFLKMKLRET